VEIEVRNIMPVGHISDEPGRMNKYAKTTLNDSTGIIDIREQPPRLF
jgi:hypothetical protein